MNKKMWTPEDKERFREMCLAGASNKELADEFNVSLFAVHHRRSTWGLTMEKCAVIKADIKVEPAPTEAHKETIKVDAEVFFAIAHELSENAEKMEKLSADNLTLKEQLFNQSQRIAELQDALEIEQAASTAHTSKLELIGQAAAILVMEFEKMEHFLGRSGLYRLFHRYKSLTQRAKDSLKAAEEAIKKEAENAGND